MHVVGDIWKTPEMAKPDKNGSAKRKKRKNTIYSAMLDRMFFPINIIITIN